MNGAAVDEFIQVLLTFPVNPDATVLEIISDSVYANSSTLHGRRFASDFVARRKADCAAVLGKDSGSWAVGAGGSSTGAIRSMADAIKAQPKPQTSDINFKVVTKSKKKR
jgi:PERQ amino acid-rich with GYF domain-containing protein